MTTLNQTDNNDIMSIKDQITPGKWEADEHNIRAENKNFSIGMAYLINVPGPHNKFAKDVEGIANARLWAASKEMLDIIERLAKADWMPQTKKEEAIEKCTYDAQMLMHKLNTAKVKQ